jgi:hypothetical protein
MSAQAKLGGIDQALSVQRKAFRKLGLVPCSGCGQYVTQAGGEACETGAHGCWCSTCLRDRDDAAEAALCDPAARLTLARWWRQCTDHRIDLAWMGEELREELVALARRGQ